MGNMGKKGEKMEKLGGRKTVPSNTMKKADKMAVLNKVKVC